MQGHDDFNILIALQLRFKRFGDFLVRGVGRDLELGIEERREVGAVELAGGLKRHDGIEMPHHTRTENCGLGDFRVFFGHLIAGGEFMVSVKYGVEDGALLRRNLRERVCEGNRVVSPDEAHRRVVSHPENILGVFRIERDFGIDRDLLHQELQRGNSGFAVAYSGHEIALCRRIELAGLVVVMEVVEPSGELVHERKALLEVLRVQGEASPAVEEPTRLRVRVERGGLSLRIGAASRLLVEVGGACELRQLGGHVTHRRRLADARRVHELAAAEHVDRRRHELDAARRERLALAEVLELHVVAHEVRDELLAAEHVRDRLEEKVAHPVVRRLHLGRAQERRERALVVACRSAFEADNGIRAFDALRVVGLVREIDELLEIRTIV